MRKFEIICSESVLSGFLEDYISDIQKPDQDIKEIQVLTFWIQILFKESDLIIDISYNRWEELFRTNQLVRILEKTSQGGGSKIQLFPGIIDVYSENKMFGEFTSLLCLTDEKCEELSTKYGRLFISRSNMKNIGKILFQESIYIISRTSNKTLKSWKELSFDSISIPSTDIVLIDNYILNKGGLENIIELLKGIVPKNQQSVTIKISIITALFNKSLPQIKEIGNSWYFNFIQNLNKHFRGFVFNVSLAIFSNRSLNHDRTLLTNYVWIGSDHGFNCFNAKGLPIVSTTVKYLPIFAISGNHDSAVSSYNCWHEFRNHAKQLINNCVFKIGDFDSNLLLK